MIDPTHQLAALIRAQFASQVHVQADRRAKGSGSEGQRAQVAQPDRAEVTTKNERIQQLVALRVQGLAQDDPNRQRKAFRIFLESVLTQELGRIRIDESRFDRMVDEVLVRMEGDEDLKAAVLEAGALLLAGAQAQGSTAR